MANYTIVQAQLPVASVGWVEARNPSQSMDYALLFDTPLPLSKPQMMGLLRLPILPC